MTMKNLKKFTYKIAALTCVASFCVMLLPAKPVKAATIGNLALALEAVEELGTTATKAQIIDFASAAGYTATSENITASATLAKGTTAAIGSVTMAVLATVGGAYAGTSYAYEQASGGFKAMFSYEECLQYIWKKAMGADDKTLLAFLYTAMDPENVEGLASGSLTFQYDFNLSKALAYTMYDAYFTSTPVYANNVVMDHYGPNPFENYSDVQFNASGGYQNYRPIDSYFPAETYLAGAKNYINSQYPDFEIDFFVMSPTYLVGYGPRWSDRVGYNGAPTIFACDFPEGYTPIYLYNEVTGRSYLTTFENPQYGLDQTYSTNRIRLEAFTFPNLHTVDYFEYGIFYHDAGTSTVPIGAASSYNTPERYTYYYWNGSSQSSMTLNPAEYGHFVNRLGFDQYSIYGIPVYTMDSGGSLSPYNLKAEQAETLPEPDFITVPSDPSAGYNPSLENSEEILKNEPVIDSYVDSEGAPVANGSSEVIERDPEPTPTPTPTPPTYDDGTPIFPVFPDFSDFFDNSGDKLNILEKFSSFLSKCLNLLPDSLVDFFWWIFVFALAIGLISVLI